MLAPEQALQRQGSATFSTGAVPRASRSRSPTKRAAVEVIQSYEEIVGKSHSQNDYDNSQQASEEPCGLDFLLQACEILEPAAPAPAGCVTESCIPRF